MIMHNIITIIFILLCFVIAFIAGQHCGYQDGYDDGEANAFNMWAERIEFNRVEDNYIDKEINHTRCSFTQDQIMPNKKKHRHRRKKHRAISDMNKVERLIYYYGDMVKINPKDFKPKHWNKKEIKAMCKRLEAELKANGQWAELEFRKE